MWHGDGSIPSYGDVAISLLPLLLLLRVVALALSAVGAIAAPVLNRCGGLVVEGHCRCLIRMDFVLVSSGQLMHQALVGRGRSSAMIVTACGERARSRILCAPPCPYKYDLIRTRPTTTRFPRINRHSLAHETKSLSCQLHFDSAHSLLSHLPVFHQLHVRICIIQRLREAEPD